MRFSKFCQFLLCFFSLIFINYARAQYIYVDTSLNAQDLVDKFIGSQNASCITVSGVSVSGWNFGGNDLSYGYFDRNGSPFDIDEGIILSTGKALAAPGPNNNRQDNYDSRWSGDPALIATLAQSGLSTDNILNATVLEFDFQSLQSDKISFDYMFLSEEYRPSNCQYSDAFAFLIKKADNTESYRNIALVPGTNIPVTSTTINGAACTNQDGHPEYFGTFNPESGNSTSPTNFNGQTKVLKAVTTVEKGVTYHIKLVIADHGDRNGIFDSAVFLKAGSFTGNIDIGTDLTIDNADPLCENVKYTIAPIPPINDPSAKYSWFKDGQPILDASGIPVTQDHYDVINEEGDFSVNVVLGSGCRLQGNVTIEKAPIAQIDSSPIPICDNDFDGKFSTVLSDYNAQIVTNYSRDFKLSYYTADGTLIPNPDDKFEFTQNPQTLIVKVQAFSCAPHSYPIQFYNGTQLSMNYPQSQPIPPVFDVCDDELAGSKEVNLEAFVDNKITAEKDTQKTFYKTEAQAKKGDLTTIISNINPIFSTSNADQTYFVRIEKSGSCPNYSSFRLLFKQPKRSAILKDTLICKATDVSLDASLGFDSYRWYNKADPLKTTISTSHETQKLFAGDYVVELGFNNCLYSQSVKISEPQDLGIINALIEGNRVTVLAENGVPPYKFKLDNGSYQSSNVFDNVPKGNHTIEVLDACGFVTRDFSIINITNVITPNGDGINDNLDYSDLLTKSEPKLEIYDRGGMSVFKGDTNNKFIWNGKLNGKTLPTSSYWYILEWSEAGNPNRVQLTGWILLKNRN